ncbi:MAG: hypothetical protein ABI672_10300 [Vicinamibacteria bacterium]
MSITKQEFYEGAAIYRLARQGEIRTIHYDSPFFFVNGTLSVLLKYSTKGRSPWFFTLTVEEQRLLGQHRMGNVHVVGLICGSDGIATLSCSELRTIASGTENALHLSCFRQHREHYEVRGPDGTLARKIPPSDWQRILGDPPVET